MTHRCKLSILCFFAVSIVTSPIWAQTECNLPTGIGQQEVCTHCIACHSLQIVTQQRLSGKVWDEVLTWMVEEQAMPKLPVAERALIIDYLESWFGIKNPR